MDELSRTRKDEPVRRTVRGKERMPRVGERGTWDGSQIRYKMPGSVPLQLTARLHRAPVRTLRPEGQPKLDQKPGIAVE